MHYENNFYKEAKDYKVEVVENLPKFNDDYRRVYGKGVEPKKLKPMLKKASEASNFMSSIRLKKSNNSMVHS